MQLEEGTGEVRHGPKGADEGGTGSSPKGERNSGVVARKRRGGAGPVGRARTQGRGVRGGRLMGCSGALAREDERGKKRG
jgi:hypothetical protein